MVFSDQFICSSHMMPIKIYAHRSSTFLQYESLPTEDKDFLKSRGIHSAIEEIFTAIVIS